MKGVCINYKNYYYCIVYMRCKVLECWRNIGYLVKKFISYPWSNVENDPIF